MTFVSHGPCENCGSSDAMSWYSDGHGFCFVCNHYASGSTHAQPLTQSQSKKGLIGMADITPLTTVFRAIPRRRLPEEAIRKYQIDINMDKSKDVAHRYPYFKDGRHVGNQIRTRDKAFPCEYVSKEDWKGRGLFGQQAFPPGSAKAITVVEGAIDAPSAYVLHGSQYPAVAVSSASTAVEECRTNYEYLNSFDEIVLCFDKDSPKVRPSGETFYPGQEAALKVAEMFAPGKCRIMTLERAKDPSDYLQKEIPAKDFVKEWWKAPRHIPDGLVYGHDLWEDIINSPKPFTVPTGIRGIDQKIYGLRLGEMITFTADPKIGKTTVLKTIEYALIKNPELQENGYGIGFMHLEEPKKDLAVGLMGLHVGKRLGLPDVEATEDELRTAFDEVVNTSRVVIWDHFGSNSVDAVVNKIRHMAALGCRYVVLDHFSMLASDQSDDERKKLDEIATRLKTLTVELNICLIGVIHQNREGKIRGTAAFEQLSNVVIRLERDKLATDEWRRNVMKVVVTENRFSGRTGPAAYLFYEDSTGRFEEIEDDETIQKYEEGLSISDADMPF